LHLVKNLRQRVRNHTVALMPDCPVVDAATFAGLVRPSVVSVPGQSGSMSDRLAVELSSPEVLAAACESGNYIAPLVFGPWTSTAAAIECATFKEAARLEELSVAFAPLGRMCKVMPKATKEYPEQGGREMVITISDRNHLHRAMNLCVALFHAIKNFPRGLALREGDHHAS
jgi:hypothetical protein